MDLPSAARTFAAPGTNWESSSATKKSLKALHTHSGYALEQKLVETASGFGVGWDADAELEHDRVVRLGTSQKTLDFLETVWLFSSRLAQRCLLAATALHTPHLPM